MIRPGDRTAGSSTLREVLPLAAEERDHILERDREWAEISALLARTASGSGGALVVEGPAGIGKTSLLKVLRSAASRNGFLVGRASGGSLEQEYSFGAVRQLFEPLVATASDPDQLFVGGAAAAAPLCGRRPPADAQVDQAPGEMLHGLYWLCVGLAELFVTVKTVETHLAHTFQKLGISSRNDLPPAISA